MEENIKITVVNHFLSNYKAILQAGGLKGDNIQLADVVSIGEIELTANSAEKDRYNFSVRFRIKGEGIVYMGFVDRKLNISRETIAGSFNDGSAS